MKKGKLIALSALALGLVTAAGCASALLANSPTIQAEAASGDTYTFSEHFTSDTNSPSGNFDDNFSYTTAKGGASIAPNYSAKYENVTLYGVSGVGALGNSISIAPRTEGYYITSVTLAFTNNYTPDFAISIGDDAADTDKGTVAVINKQATYTNEDGFRYITLTHSNVSDQYNNVYLDFFTITYEARPVISLEPASKTIDEGTTLALTATVFNVSDEITYEWTTSDATKVSLTNENSSTITVTGAGVGSATVGVTASWGQGNTLTASSEITVVTVRPNPTGVEFANGTNATIIQNGTITLEPKVLPEGADQTITWSVTDSDKVIDLNEETGVVTSTGAFGSATVTATSAADSTKSATITVTVRKATVAEILANGVQGSSYTFDAYVCKENYDTTYFYYDVTDASFNGTQTSENAIRLYFGYKTDKSGSPNEAPDLVLGDFVTITGTLGYYNEQKQIQSPRVDSKSNTSKALEDFVLGANTYKQCESKFPVAKALYLSLSESEQTAFQASAAATRYEAWALALGESAYTAGNSSNNVLADNAGIIVLGSMLGIAAVAVAVSLAIVHNKRKSKAN